MAIGTQIDKSSEGKKMGGEGVGSISDITHNMWACPYEH